MNSQNGAALCGNGVTASARAHHPAHDPRLAPPLGDQPARLERRRSRAGPSATTASNQRRPRAAAAAAQRERREPTSAASAIARARADHHLERECASRRPAASRRAETPPARSRARRNRRTRGTTGRPGSPSAPRNSAGLQVGTAADAQRRARASVCKCASSAASFSGCATARCLAERSPDIGCTSAVTHAIGSASASALRCSVRVGSRSSMSRVDRRHRQRGRLVAGRGARARPGDDQDGLAIAAESKSTGAAARREPGGWFMNAFTSVTKNADAAPLAATAMPDARCIRADTCRARRGRCPGRSPR